MIAEVRTERLLLRRWHASDRIPFAAINGDPRVMAFLGGPLPRDRSDDLIERFEEHFEVQGFGFWCLEVPGAARCAGFVGLNVPRFKSHFTPCVELGWRLAPALWGRGYATEAARSALDVAFGTLDLREVVAFTVPANAASRAVMARLGMTRDPADDFDHPLLAEGHPLRQHVLYRIARDDWRQRPPPVRQPQ